MLHYNIEAAEMSEHASTRASADMKWFRSNIRHGSRLALFALAVQLALSFGHIHLEQLASRSGIASVVASKASTSQQDPAQRQTQREKH